MRDYAQQAKKALEVYLNRGTQALDSAKLGDVDSLNNLLGMRRAAFHNFRAADGLAGKSGVSKANSDDLLALWQKIREIDALLMEQIQGIRMDLAAQLARCAENKKTMNRYRSGKSKSVQLETPI